MYGRNEYANREINGQVHVWLQEWGWQPAILGSELRVGTIIMYNYGGRGEIVSVDKVTAKTVVISVKSLARGDSGKVYSGIRIRKSTYKPIAVTDYEKRS